MHPWGEAGLEWQVGFCVWKGQAQHHLEGVSGGVPGSPEPGPHSGGHRASLSAPSRLPADIYTGDIGGAQEAALSPSRGLCRETTWGQERGPG